MNTSTSYKNGEHNKYNFFNVNLIYFPTRLHILITLPRQNITKKSLPPPKKRTIFDELFSVNNIF